MKTIYFLSGFIFSLMFIMPVQAQDQPDSNSISLWIGTYSGKLPCNNCEGKKYRLSLNPDYTYQEEIKHSGQSQKTLTNYGKYSVSKTNVLKLNSKTKKEPSKQFISHTNGLILLENTQAIDEKYALTKKGYVNVPARYAFDNKKMQEGVLFYASGEKQEWELNIRTDQTLSLQIGPEEIIIPGKHQPIEIDDYTVEYKILTGEQEVNIHIQQGFIKTIGNKKILQSKVIIDTRKNLELKFTHREGYGNYIPDAALQSKWIVKSMYQNPFHGQNPPTVKLFLKEGKISGTTGCNSFSGRVDFSGNKITVGQLMNTMMFCQDDNDNEQVFLEILNGKTFTYRLKDDALILMENKIQVMELKRLTFEQ